MKYKKITRTMINTLFIVLCITANAQDGATLFQPCAACHSIGGGPMIGPDLKGITQRRTNEWLIRFIQSPSEMLKSGDAQAIAVFKEFNNVPMPNSALTAEQINKILEHIDGSVAFAADTGRIDKTKQRIDSILKANSPQDIQRGFELFNGITRFENKGASCAACHNVTYNNISKGGLLAKDLTKAYSRLNGFAGMRGIISMPPFPSMTETFKNNAVTEEENAYLLLFLRDADARNLSQPMVQKAWFIIAALPAVIFVALMIALLWIKRRYRSVNYSIIKRQVKYSK